MPATPLDSTCVVLTGRPNRSEAKDGAGCHHLGNRALAIGQVLAADALADGFDYALPADGGAKAQHNGDDQLDPEWDRIGLGVQVIVRAGTGRTAPA